MKNLERMFWIGPLCLIIAIACGPRRLESVPAEDQGEPPAPVERSWGEEIPCQCEDGSTTFIHVKEEEKPQDESMDVRRGVEERERQEKAKGVRASI